MRSELRGDLKRVSPSVAGAYDEIAIEMDLSGPRGAYRSRGMKPNRLSVWPPEPPRLHRDGWVEFDHALLNRFEPCPNAPENVIAINRNRTT